MQKTKMVMGAAVALLALASSKAASDEISGQAIVTLDQIAEMKKEEDSKCLAEALIFEAGNQPIVGKLAVAEVILNRMRSKRYPNSICEVVHEGPTYKWFEDVHNKIVPVKNRCQFSYYCDGKSDDLTPFYRTKTWDDVTKVVVYMMHRTSPYISNLLDGATHYHADYVDPKWSRTLTKVVQIDNHIFYK
jgi:spore germination cell wall hydrolase CwlJ-like protein